MPKRSTGLDVTEAARKLVERTTAAQSLPEKVEDRDVLDKVVWWLVK